MAQPASYRGPSLHVLRTECLAGLLSVKMPMLVTSFRDGLKAKQKTFIPKNVPTLPISA